MWRLRLHFNEQDEPSNFLSQIQAVEQPYDSIHSLSHLDDCVNACLGLWVRRGPFGIYNVVNPGAVSTHDILQMIQRILKPPRQFRLLVYEHEPLAANVKASPAGCILDVSKLQSTGVKLRHVREALESSLRKWEPRRVRRVGVMQG